MAKKCPKCECPAGEKWAVPFADFLSLLLALFIALYALASVNIEKQAALKEEFLKIYGMNTESKSFVEPQEDSQVATTEEETDQDTEGKAAQLEQTIAMLSEANNEITDGTVIDGTFMAMPIYISFDNGRAEITSKKDLNILQSIANILYKLPEQSELNLKGYASDSEIIKGGKYQDSLELSTARANYILRELIKLNVPKDRLFSSGYGSNQTDSNDKHNGRVELELKIKRVVAPEENLQDINRTMFFNN